MKLNLEQEKSPQCFHIYDGESKRIQKPDKIITEGVGPCHAIGILNSEKGLGYLGHFHFDTNYAKDLLDQAIKESSSPDELKVVLAGNVPPSNQEIIDIGENVEEVLGVYRKHKEWLLELLKTNNIKPENIQNYLADKYSEDSYKMEVDTKTNKIEVEKVKDRMENFIEK